MKRDLDLDRPIALIGPRCAGKSTAGARLAELLGLSFVDLDERVALQAERAGVHGLTRAGDVLAALGRARFRELEAAALRAVLEPQPVVVLATGGGVVERPDNRAWLRRSARVFWLDAADETLARRAELDPSPRPALVAGADAQSEPTLLRRRRNRWYAELSEARVETDELDPDEVARALAAALASGEPGSD